MSQDKSSAPSAELPIDAQFELLHVKGKRIYVVDDHHRALAAWALLRREMHDAPNLITIDHHTDTHDAFLGYASIEHYEGRANDEDALRIELTEKIDWRQDSSILEAISRLKHDEHINAATTSGVLGRAFCIQLSDNGGHESIDEAAFNANRQARWPDVPTLPVPTRPMRYEESEDRVYVIPAPCFLGCTARTHNDACAHRHADEIIESKYLEDQLARAAEISSCLGLTNIEAGPYILDIDLDAFHSRRAINPDDASTFHRLIRNAVAITVATEAECVDELWRDDADPMDSTDLLAELVRHIDQAL